MAGSNSFRGDDDGAGMIVDINVTPLVDITLVLLIIFMVTASYIVSPAIKVDLPKAASGTERLRSAATIASYWFSASDWLAASHADSSFAGVSAPIKARSRAAQPDPPITLQMDVANARRTRSRAIRASA